MKQCTKCKTEQPEANFKKDATRHDGLFPQCKDCTRAYRQANAEKIKMYRKEYQDSHKEHRKEYNERNAEKIKAYRKQYEAQNAERISARRKTQYWRNLEESREYSRKVQARRQKNVPLLVRAATKRYRERYPELAKERAKKYRELNREKVAETNRRYRINNREKVRQKRRVRRARKFSHKEHFTLAQWQTLKAEHNYTCLCCGKAEPEIELQPDHVVPLARGGNDSILNIQPLCKMCNLKKGVKHIDYRTRKVEQLELWD